LMAASACRPLSLISRRGARKPSIFTPLKMDLRAVSLAVRSGFHVARFTQVLLERQLAFHVRDCHPLWSDFPCSSVKQLFGNSHVRSPTTLRGKSPKFGLFRLRSALLTESIFPQDGGVGRERVERGLIQFIIRECAPGQPADNSKSNRQGGHCFFHVLRSFLI
jgi:hypothetical protein